MLIDAEQVVLRIKAEAERSLELFGNAARLHNTGEIEYYSGRSNGLCEAIEIINLVLAMTPDPDEPTPPRKYPEEVPF